MKIHMISAALPPMVDGIGDYSANIAQELAKHIEVKVLTGLGPAPSVIPGVTVRQVFHANQPRSVRDLLPVITADAPDWVLLQYNPFSYGRRGLNLYLPQMIGRLKKEHPNIRVAVMAHETFMPPINPKFAVMSLWQRAQLWSLGNSADLLFFSIQYWVRKFARWFPDTPIHHLPVGSNIQRVETSRAEARVRLGIADDTLVLGLFGTAHPSRMLDWIRDAADAIVATGRKILILYMGPDGPAVRRIFEGLPLLAEGPLSAEEVSRRFAAVDIAPTPFHDGVSTRRTSMMTPLQHGIPIVGNIGAWSDPMLISLDGEAMLLAASNDSPGFCTQMVRLAGDTGLRRKIGEAGRELYDRSFRPACPQCPDAPGLSALQVLAP